MHKTAKEKEQFIKTVIEYFGVQTLAAMSDTHKNTLMKFIELSGGDKDVADVVAEIKRGKNK